MNIKKGIISAATAALLLTGGIASAQTTGTTTPDTTVTPGTPNTGSGGDATMNWIVLSTAGLLALVGVGYLARRSSRTTN